MKVCGGQSVGWIADARKWPLKRPRLCWSQTGDPSHTRGLFLGEHEIEWKKSIKYLGVQSDRWLSFGKHLQIATAKAIQCRAALTQLMPNIDGPREAKRRLVASVVNSKLIEGAPVWKSALNNRAIQKKLFTAQRGVVLRIASAYRTVSTSTVLVIIQLSPSLHCVVTFSEAIK